MIVAFSANRIAKRLVLQRHVVDRPVRELRRVARLRSSDGSADGDAVDSTYGVLDEDNFASNSSTDVPTQQSTKAYVDATVKPITSINTDITPSNLNPAPNETIDVQIDVINATNLFSYGFVYFFFSSW